MQYSMLPTHTPISAHLAIIPVVLNDFRCHPVWSSNKCVPFGQCTGQLRGDPKVCQFDLRRLSQQDVPTFHVTVDDAELVQVRQSLGKRSVRFQNITNPCDGFNRHRQAPLKALQSSRQLVAVECGILPLSEIIKKSNTTTDHPSNCEQQKNHSKTSIYPQIYCQLLLRPLLPLLSTCLQYFCILGLHHYSDPREGEQKVGFQLVMLRSWLTHKQGKSDVPVSFLLPGPITWIQSTDSTKNGKQFTPNQRPLPNSRKQQTDSVT